MPGKRGPVSFVTSASQAEGARFVHSGYYAVLPPREEMAEVGAFGDCAAVNACAMCSPDCHVPDRAGGVREFDGREEAEGAARDDEAS